MSDKPANSAAKPWIEFGGAGATLKMKIQPGAKSTTFVGVHDGRLRIKVNAAPVEGAANKALCKALAKWAGLRQRDVEIVAGEKSREKAVRLAGMTPATWQESRLAALINEAISSAE